MTTWLIIIFGLWTYPVISLILLWLTKKKPDRRKQIFYSLSIMTVLAFLGMATHISTTLSELDWLILSSFYFTVSFALLWTQFQTRKVIKIFGAFLIFFVLGVGYLSGTVGALGVGFIIGNYETAYEKWYDDGIIYKETSIGNAISDVRGKKVEIYKTLKWFPFIEWRVKNKEYYSSVTYLTTPLTVDCKPDKEEIILTAKYDRDKGNKQEMWTDTLRIK